MEIKVFNSTTKIIGEDICEVKVECSDYIYAYECRATPVNNPYGRGKGIDLLFNEVFTTNGVHELKGPTKSFSFTIDANVLFSDGNYRISIYVRDSEGKWWGDIPEGGS